MECADLARFIYQIINILKSNVELLFASVFDIVMITFVHNNLTTHIEIFL